MIDISEVPGPIRLFLSAGPYTRDGFLSTQQEQLDLLKREDWETSFCERRIAAILCEHVWEHLTVADGKVAAKTCFDYLEPGGYVPLRCARRTVSQRSVSKAGGGQWPRSRRGS